LPLHNAAGEVELLVSELLEVLPELVAGFEIAIVDDASTDATAEIAHELSLRFPQVRMVCHSTRQGHDAALHTAGCHATGDVLLLADATYPLEARSLGRLWREISQHDVVLGVHAGVTRMSRGGAGRSRSWLRPRRRILVPSEPGPIMLRRFVMKDWTDAKTDRASWIATLTAKEYHWIAVDMNDGETSPRGRDSARLPAGHDLAEVEKFGKKASVVSPVPLEPRRPNYLTQLRDFALGE